MARGIHHCKFTPESEEDCAINFSSSWVEYVFLYQNIYGDNEDNEVEIKRLKKGKDAAVFLVQTVAALNVGYLLGLCIFDVRQESSLRKPPSPAPYILQARAKKWLGLTFSSSFVTLHCIPSCSVGLEPILVATSMF